MVFDWDDFSEENNRLDLLNKLHGVRQDFKCTVFAIPAMGTVDFWDSIPEWIELAVHGWEHPHSREAENWTYAEMGHYMSQVHPRFVKGFKAPGWQISQDSFDWLKDHRWWVADQDYNDRRRPDGLRVYKFKDHKGYHGHIQNVCGNGLEDNFFEVDGLVREALEFKFISEVV